MSSPLPCWCVTITAQRTDTGENWNAEYHLHDARAWNAKSRAHLQFIDDHDGQPVRFLGSHVELCNGIITL